LVALATAATAESLPEKAVAIFSEVCGRYIAVLRPNPTVGTTSISFMDAARLNDGKREPEPAMKCNP
jgi:hypothetical protein